MAYILNITSTTLIASFLLDNETNSREHQ